ncbi:hypothetical protein DSO57_1011078 [Entomophthora muscae]|uniref:Uncharacterized protein n=1 Tax=Entomophthora muscae TaxID=34485 RepID=A0ACC2SJ48_9FUNG|nr:hypothetical protein DSO57_1011078 [Entomophthora muscae]
MRGGYSPWWLLGPSCVAIALFIVMVYKRYYKPRAVESQEELLLMDTFNSSDVQSFDKRLRREVLDFKKTQTIQYERDISTDFFCEFFLLKVPDNASIVIGLAPESASACASTVFGPTSIAFEVTRNETPLGTVAHAPDYGIFYEQGDTIRLILTHFPKRTVSVFKNGNINCTQHFPGSEENLRSTIFATKGTKIAYNFGKPDVSLHSVKIYKDIAEPEKAALNPELDSL